MAKDLGILEDIWDTGSNYGKRLLDPGGTIWSQEQGGGEEAASAREAQAQAVKDWEGLESREPGYQEAGLYTQGASQAGQAYADPEAIRAQQEALSQYRNLSQEGFSAADRAQMERIASQEDQRARGGREAVSQDLAARGMASSGQRMVGQQMAQQGAAERMSARGLGVAEMGQARRREALAGMAGMGTQMRGQSFGEAQRRGQAEDIRNQFNVGMRAQQDTENQGRRQQQYQNYAQATAGKSGARQNQAAMYQNQQQVAAERPTEQDRFANIAGTGMKAFGM